MLGPLLPVISMTTLVEYNTELKLSVSFYYIAKSTLFVELFASKINIQTRSYFLWSPDNTI